VKGAERQKDSHAARTQVGSEQRLLLTDRELAARLGFSQQYLKDDRRGVRLIPFVKLGRRMVRYRLRDVEAAIDRMVVRGRRS
jgi:predicted DNA-binding transcriptional regulator AlpA